ncbi:hypothetical protein [Pseudomonas sp. KNUC1026]|uniref:hypothetical protein n=1 Tax=Pseudomonas sp. KNUC1026 TaxID=2893890 RepID=UPI002E3270F0|nr:hypothetical protein [Pseudomonas sp. KNUC1026]
MLEPQLCERLIDRLGLALDAARTACGLGNELPDELELRGLSHAEIRWINAYLQAIGEPAVGKAPNRRAERDNVVWLRPEPSDRTLPPTPARRAR